MNVGELKTILNEFPDYAEASVSTSIFFKGHTPVTGVQYNASKLLVVFDVEQPSLVGGGDYV